jgi:hypothetical protein
MKSRQLLTSAVLPALIAIIALCGCSAFKGSRKMDMSPFAENAGMLFAEAAKVNRPFEFKNLRPYTSIAEFQQARAQAEPLIVALRGVVFYSNQVVAINNAKLSDKDKNQHLAHYLSEVMEKSMATSRSDSLGFDEAAARTVLDNIRASKTYLQGIAAAGPIVNAVVGAMQARLDTLQHTILPGVIAELDRKIEADVADTRTNYVNLKSLQALSMRALNLVYQCRMGDRAALDALFTEDPSVKEIVRQPDKVTSKELADVEQYLLERLGRIDGVIHQLDYDVAEYKAKRDELEAFRLSVDEKVKVARQALMIWAQAHRNLGAGIPVPPMIDIPGITGGLVGEAKKVVL